MAKEIRWSVRADLDRIEILEYWTRRNKSPTYSIKLNKLFNSKIERLAQHPESGSPTEVPNVRTKIVRDYLVYYSIELAFIEVITIWDSRRNPKKFRL